MRKLLPLFLVLYVASCKFERPTTGPSWDTTWRIPMGDTIISAYDLARKLAGKDSVNIVRIGREMYWLERDTVYNDTVNLPADTTLASFFIDFNRPDFVLRGHNTTFIRDVFAIAKIYFDTVTTDLNATVKVFLTFLETDTYDTITISGINIPAGTKYFEDTIRDLYLKAESTFVDIKIFTNTGRGIVAIVDSAFGFLYAPPHVEAYDTIILSKLMDITIDTQITETYGLKEVEVGLFLRHSVPMQMFARAFMVDTLTWRDTIFIDSFYIKDPPKDAQGYSTGFTTDTIIVILDTNHVNFINQYGKTMKIDVLGIVPAVPTQPYRSYTRADDSLNTWGYVKFKAIVNERK